MKLTARSSIVDVGIQLSTQHDVDMKKHCAMFLKLLECVRYLARQGLPFCGHHEDSVSLEGNLLQLLLLQAKDYAPLGSWLKKREYISPEIINEVITICGQMILRQLLKTTMPQITSLWSLNHHSASPAPPIENIFLRHC